MNTIFIYTVTSSIFALIFFYQGLSGFQSLKVFFVCTLTFVVFDFLFGVLLFVVARIVNKKGFYDYLNLPESLRGKVK